MLILKHLNMALLITMLLWTKVYCVKMEIYLLYVMGLVQV